MIELLKKENWSDAFLLPLTGLKKDKRFEMRSHLFWNEYNIHDYKLILTFSCDDYDDMLDYCRKEVFPILDKKGYLMENYDIQGRSIFILDVAEWSKDIEMFILGKYSLFSERAKHAILRYHIIPGTKEDVPIHIYACLYPTTAMSVLGNKSAIEYACSEYGFDYDEMKRIGEIGSIYDKMRETLITEIDQLI